MPQGSTILTESATYAGKTEVGCPKQFCSAKKKFIETEYTLADPELAKLRREEYLEQAHAAGYHRSA